MFPSVNIQVHLTMANFLYRIDINWLCWSFYFFLGKRAGIEFNRVRKTFYPILTHLFLLIAVKNAIAPLHVISRSRQKVNIHTHQTRKQHTQGNQNGQYRKYTVKNNGRLFLEEPENMSKTVNLIKWFYGFHEKKHLVTLHTTKTYKSWGNFRRHRLNKTQKSEILHE